MKKATIKVREVEANDMRAEYDFRGGVRGKHRNVAVNIRQSIVPYGHADPHTTDPGL